MEPERHIERLLRAFAKTRREQAGPPSALHPATRRMLQGEVARQHLGVNKGKVAWRLGWGSLWPRIAFAAAMLVLLGIGAFLVFPPAKDSPATMTLAKQESAARPVEAMPSAPALSAPPSAMPVAGSTVEEVRQVAQPRAKTVAVVPPLASRKASDKQVVFQTNAPMRREATRSDAAPGLAGAKPAEPSLPLTAANREAATRIAGATSRRETLAAELKTASSLAPGTTAGQRYREEALVARGGGASGSNLTPPASYGGKPARRTLSSVPVDAATDSRQSDPPSALAKPVAPILPDASEVAVQNFARLDMMPASAARKAAVGDVVLASFQLEQRGQQVRIVDRDGSVYTGTLGMPSTATPATLAEQSPAFFAIQDKAKTATGAGKVGLQLDRKAQDSQESLLFSVRGTNTTLQQVVVFTGNVQQLPGGYQYGLSNQSGGATGRYQNVFPAQNQLQNARVSGRARLTDGRQLEINAVAVPGAGQQGPK